MYAPVKLAAVGANNVLSPVQRQTTVWTNADVMLSGHFKTYLREVWIKIQEFSS